MAPYIAYFILATAVVLCKARKGPIDDSYKLPSTVKPIRYTLTMEPELDVTIATPMFTGSVTIELETLATTSNITLHSRSLNISDSSITLTNNNGTELVFLNTSVDESREFFTIHVEDELLAGEHYNLSLEFSGYLKYDNVGFYLAAYEDKDHQKWHIALTDFEPSDARKAFPCFDEPALKATFIIHIIRPEKYNSVANDELLYTENLGEGRYRDVYKETVVMSTYLVAFAVSQYKHTAQIERHRVFARPEAIDSGKLDYALSEGVEILNILEEFTGVNYTVNKMDQLAVPNKYFNDEAMENWGLVTFSEKHLFITNETSKTEDKQRCTSYIAHEFGHQWFGNLVTFKDWKYIWLSEGFGAYLQYYITSLAKPSWRYMDQFVLTILHEMLNNDASNDTQPMNYKPKYIGAIPSPWICYFKASSVIRMIDHFLTTPIFRRGLNIYLEKHKFTAVEPSDLYQALQKAVDEASAHQLLGNLSVSEIMATWDSNSGHPVLTVSRDYDKGAVTISQNRYYSDDKLNSEEIWCIPISYVFESDTSLNFSDTTANIWLTQGNLTISGNVTPNGWFLVNKQQTGYYRVNYDLTNWERLGIFLNSDNYKSIHVVNRAQLLFDAFHFAMFDRLPFKVPLNLSKYLIRERDYVPISTFLNAMQQVNSLMGTSKMHGIFQKFVVNSISTAYDHVGFEEKSSDTNLDRLNRIELLKWLCLFGNLECRSKALKMVHEWKAGGQLLVSPDLEGPVLCCAMKNATIEDWEFLYNQSQIDTDKSNQYFEAMSCSENENILLRFADIIFNNLTKMTTRDKSTSLITISSHKMGINTLLKYVKNNPELPDKNLFKYSGYKWKIYNYLSFVLNYSQSTIGYYVGLRCNDEVGLTEMKALNNKGLFNYGIKLAQQNIDWINRKHKKQVEEWLLTYSQDNLESANIV